MKSLWAGKIWGYFAAVWVLAWVLLLIYLHADRAQLDAEITTGVLGTVAALALWLTWRLFSYLPRQARITAAGLVSVLVPAYWAFLYLEPFKHDAISFEERVCAKPYSPGSSPRAVNAAWEGDVLMIKASVCINCASKVERVTAQVTGNVVWLMVYPKRGEAKCDCERTLEIQMRDLPKRDYTIRGISEVRDCA